MQYNMKISDYHVHGDNDLTINNIIVSKEKFKQIVEEFKEEHKEEIITELIDGCDNWITFELYEDRLITFELLSLEQRQERKEYLYL